MCGIAGFSGMFDADLLQRMNARIEHRGPDDQHEVVFTNCGNTVGLAHRRLSIIDLSANGRQPMSTTCTCCNNGRNDNKIWLIYNGEIYNYRSLREQLLAKGHQFITQTDSEVLIHLYAEYGTAMLEKLNGIFAFAIYDGRQQSHLQRGDLFLARDGLGVKPLYYSDIPAGFLFASELKALLVYSALSRALDMTALHYYLAYLWCPGEQTALTHVKKLQPGEAMLVRGGKIVRQWFYYDLPYPNLPLTRSKTALIADLDQHLTAAVARQLMADVPLGAFLSGGLDSSAIAAMMRKLNPKAPIQCYTIAFAEGLKSEGSPDDLPYAKAVAKHLRLDLKVIVPQANILHALSKMIYHLDEPTADPAPLHVFSIAEYARAEGIKVLLSGTGGDDIFSGYRRHQALQLEHYWQWLPALAKNQLGHYAEALLAGKYRMPVLKHTYVRRLASLLASAHLPLNHRIAQYFLWNNDHLRRYLYSPEMQAQTSELQTLAPLLKSLARIPDEKHKLNRMLYLEAKHFLSDHNLNYTDKMAMAAGVEVRVPLLDPDLIHFASRLPVHLKQNGMQGKYLLKKTMEAYLPKSIIYRKKTGFGAPLRKWIREDMRDFINDNLSMSTLKRRGLFQGQAVHELIAQNQKGQVDASYTIFSLLCIELWCQQFIDV